MATAASLHSELRSLGSSSKRHNPELSHSSDKSSSILDAASQSFDNDNAIIASLRKYDDFVTPFILACKEASAKSCASALQCIQILATYKAISPTRLGDLLQALMEATQLGLGIQLKILQVLPVILFEFSADLSGDLVSQLLQVCAELLGSNKVAMVHNAAYATLQQLITGVFDRTEIPESVGVHEGRKKIVIDSAKEVEFDVSPRLYDSAMIWSDLCDIAEKMPPKFLKINDLPLTFTLELLELTFANQAALIHKHKEFAAILRLRVIPLLLRLFSEASEFPIVLRVARIFYLLLRRHLDILTTESEVILSTLAQSSLQGPSWKQVTSLEVIQGVLMEVDLLYQIYSKYDGENGRLNVIETIATDFATTMSNNNELLLASEISKELYDQAYSSSSSRAAAASSGSTKEPSELVINSSGSNNSSSLSMILNKNSATATPVIEMLDRIEPPKIKPGHPFYLIIKCIISLSDDIHRLASTERTDVSSLLQSLGTPLLKCFSIALGLAMDLELFRLVVRAVQKLAHASGIASVRDLRDEFMQLLVQYCYIPEDTSGKPWIIGRCSLCVRALFNLGYALGNQLEGSWSLIVGAISRLSQQIPFTEPRSLDSLFGNNSAEYRNMNAALKKLIESTVSHSNDALNSFMNALGIDNGVLQCEMLRYILQSNAARFSNPDTKCWATFSKILLDNMVTSENPFFTFDILNNASLIIMETVSASPSGDEQTIDRSLSMVINTITVEMESTDLRIKIATINHLNILIDKFGAWMSLGWEDVFNIVSTIPSTNQLDLMRPAFHTLELICSDFLDRLPYACVFNLTICLDEYSRQTSDLNISFTSTSLFWSVCDHLMGDNDMNEINADSINTENELVAVAKDYNSSSKRIALWLLAVTRLAYVARTALQQQVRTSAIQIFLRLFGTHGANLTPGAWDITHKLVFPALLEAAEKSAFRDINEMEETSILIIDGLSRVSLLFGSQFSQFVSVRRFWEHWMQFLEDSTPKTAKIAETAYVNLKMALGSDSGHWIPRKAVSEFWVKQSPSPSFSETSPKLTSDALRELVLLFDFIREECNTSQALKLISNCALFPYHTSASPSSMSSLQLACTSALDSFQINMDSNLIGELLISLNQLSLAPYNNDDNVGERSRNQFIATSTRNFVALSGWALAKLLALLTDVDVSDSNFQNNLSDVVPKVFSGMNKVARLGSNQIIPAQIILHLIKYSPSLEQYDGAEIVENIRIILDGTNNTDISLRNHDQSISEVIAYLDKFIETVKTKSLPGDKWNDILLILLKNSVLYERSIHNLRFYDEDLPTDLEEALQFGTVDPPRLIHSKDISFHCLVLLRQLGSDNNVYAEKSLFYFNRRVRAVLSQYIGECTLLGQEPLRIILHEELIAVLKQLKICSESSAQIHEHTYKLLLATLSNAHREILPLLQAILRN